VVRTLYSASRPNWELVDTMKQLESIRLSTDVDLKVLERVSVENWQECERFWMLSNGICVVICSSTRRLAVSVAAGLDA
jgi:hypothetical protein